MMFVEGDQIAEADLTGEGVDAAGLVEELGSTAKALGLAVVRWVDGVALEADARGGGKGFGDQFAVAVGDGGALGGGEQIFLVRA